MRLEPYCFDDYISEPRDDCKCAYHPIEEYDSVRRLSQVSRQITAEFGQCLWKNSFVNFPEPELFLVFFRDRPQVWSNVQGISLTISYQQECWGATTTSLLLKILEFVAQNLNLRFFTIYLRTNWSAFVYMPSTLHEFEKMHEWVVIFRSFKVKEAFCMKMIHYGLG